MKTHVFLYYFLFSSCLCLAQINRQAQYSSPAFYGDFKPTNQRDLASDTLTVLRSNQLSIYLYPNAKMKLSADDEWKTLIGDFQRHLSRIQGQLPAYDLFKIYYIQGQSLTMDELQGHQVYVPDAEGNYTLNQAKTCLLVGSNISIKMEINQLVDVHDVSLMKEIEEAIQAVAEQFGFSAKGDVFEYRVKDQLVIFQNEPKIKLVATIGAGLQYFRGRPMTSFRNGIGFQFGRKKQALLFNFNFLNQFEQDKERVLSEVMFGLTYLIPKSRFAMELALVGNVPEEVDQPVIFKERTLRNSAYLLLNRYMNIGVHAYYGLERSVLSNNQVTLSLGVGL